MFNMILVILAILLVAIMGGTAYFYGGTSMTDNVVTTLAAQYRSEATQIASAVTLFRTHGNTITEEFKLQDLVDLGYLRTLPKDWEPGADVIMRQLPEDEASSEPICAEANSQAGFKFEPSEDDVQPLSSDPAVGIPHCDKPMSNLVPCCVVPDANPV